VVSRIKSRDRQMKLGLFQVAAPGDAQRGEAVVYLILGPVQNGL